MYEQFDKDKNGKLSVFEYGEFHKKVYNTQKIGELNYFTHNNYHKCTLKQEDDPTATPSDPINDCSSLEECYDAALAGTPNQGYSNKLCKHREDEVCGAFMPEGKDWLQGCILGRFCDYLKT